MAKTKVVIRVDGNSNIGLGHIYRGIALAEMLRDEFDISFLVKSDTTSEPISDAGFTLNFIPVDVELSYEPKYLANKLSKDTIVVLDGYDFKETYQQKIKNLGFKLVYIDDLTEGTQKADLVINHSPGVKERDYKKESYTKLLLGLDYALLRKSFIDSVTIDESRIGTSGKSVLVSFGGADPDDLTLEVVNNIISIDDIAIVNVMLGAAYKHKGINKIQSKKLRLYRNLSSESVVELMKACDLAVVPASTTSVELAFIGVPMVLGYYVDNQKQIYAGFTDGKLAESVTCTAVGDFNEFDFATLTQEIYKALNKSKKPLKITPQKNIIKEFFKLNTSVRKVDEEDIDFVFQLSNELSVRLSSYNTEKISYVNHTKWFANQLSTSNFFYIVEFGGESSGQIRFSQNEEYSIIGISISESFRGKGLASTSLELVTKEYFKNNQKPILAYIKNTNKASVKTFQKAGFTLHHEDIINGNDSFVYIKEKK